MGLATNHDHTLLSTEGRGLGAQGLLIATPGERVDLKVFDDEDREVLLGRGAKSRPPGRSHRDTGKERDWEAEVAPSSTEPQPQCRALGRGLGQAGQWVEADPERARNLGRVGPRDGKGAPRR